MARKADSEITPNGSESVGQPDSDPVANQGGSVTTAGSGRSRRGQKRKISDANAEVADSLSFREAQAALELSLAQLQASDLDVEMMADLYRRAESYAKRCECLLEQVEQDVMQWDPEDPTAASRPLQE